jgi:hypothetical protein
MRKDTDINGDKWWNDPDYVAAKEQAWAEEQERTLLVAEALDREALARVCAMGEREFASYYGLETVKVPQPKTENFYCFVDNGCDVLAVAHLDTVMPAHRRNAGFLDTQDGPVIYSGALDDRLGAYILLELLPSMGIDHDILLTTGEEIGRSTAAFFAPEKEYNWMIEFDRGGSDVVMYQYDDYDTRGLVRACGARVGEGIFTDICYLDSLEVKGFNWGVGYQDYHGPRSHAYLDDTAEMVGHYLKFHEANSGTYLPHDDAGMAWWNDPVYDSKKGVDEVDEEGQWEDWEARTSASEDLSTYRRSIN